MPELSKLVAEELGTAVDPRVNAMASQIAKHHGSASSAVLFYGSCLREEQLDGLMLDFYLIVSDYSNAYKKRWLRLANRLIPPNVFYFEDDGLRSKYAVLSEADFAHECSKDAWTVSTAARFAQPSRLVWAKDQLAADRTIAAVSDAPVSLLSWTLPLSDPSDLLGLWQKAFALTFASELRAEQLDRSSALVNSDPKRYERVGTAALAILEPLSISCREAHRWWRSKQRHGKLYSIARLSKASFTFSGGPDYLAWKINRHAGTQIKLKPWQKRHPLLASILLLPQLIRSGAIR